MKDIFKKVFLWFFSVIICGILVYITTVTLVNNGNAMLYRPDFKAETNPLRIEGKHMESVFVDKINTTLNSRIALVKRRGRISKTK